jgi:hypothetical protein
MRRLKLAYPVGLILASYGCSLIRSPSDITGQYELICRTMSIHLSVKSSHQYSEQIIFSGEESRTVNGTWTWGGNSICFGNFAIPGDLVPKDLIGLYATKASVGYGGKTTYRDNWCFSAERVFGKKRLAIFPDFDIAFQESKAE